MVSALLKMDIFGASKTQQRERDIYKSELTGLTECGTFHPLTDRVDQSTNCSVTPTECEWTFV